MSFKTRTIGEHQAVADIRLSAPRYNFSSNSIHAFKSIPITFKGPVLEGKHFIQVSLFIRAEAVAVPLPRAGGFSGNGQAVFDSVPEMSRRAGSRPQSGADSSKRWLSSFGSKVTPAFRRASKVFQASSQPAGSQPGIVSLHWTPSYYST